MVRIEIYYSIFIFYFNVLEIPPFQLQKSESVILITKFLMMDFLIAFFGGLLSFVSPCVFPLIPAYLALFAGVSLKEISSGSSRETHLRVFTNSLLFVLGFSLTFTLLGASASFVGNILKSFKREFTVIAGLLLFVFGLHLIGIIKIPFLLEEKRADLSRISQKLPLSIFAFVSGFLFAFGWTPCIGPILAGILTLAASHNSVFEGITLLFTYSMGLGVPFLLSAVFISYFLSLSNKVKKFLRVSEVFAGGLLVIISLLFISGKISALSNLSLPNLEEAGLKLLEKLNIKGNFSVEFKGDEENSIAEINEREGGYIREDFPYVLLRRVFSANPVNGIFPDKSDFIIVNFWATWCPPCKKEIPDFVESVKKYENLLVIGISYDKSVSDVVEFIEREKINYPVYMFSDIIKDGEWEPEGLPQSFLFYKGKFLGSIVGMMDAEEISLFVSKNFSFIER